MQQQAQQASDRGMRATLLQIALSRTRVTKTSALTAPRYWCPSRRFLSWYYARTVAHIMYACLAKTRIWYRVHIDPVLAVDCTITASMYGIDGSPIAWCSHCQSRRSLLRGACSRSYRIHAVSRCQMSRVHRKRSCTLWHLCARKGQTLDALGLCSHCCAQMLISMADCLHQAI